jgi:hypothetical protein
VDPGALARSGLINQRPRALSDPMKPNIKVIRSFLAGIVAGAFALAHDSFADAVFAYAVPVPKAIKAALFLAAASALYTGLGTFGIWPAVHGFLKKVVDFLDRRAARTVGHLVAGTIGVALVALWHGDRGLELAGALLSIDMGLAVSYWLAVVLARAEFKARWQRWAAAILLPATVLCALATLLVSSR